MAIELECKLAYTKAVAYAPSRMSLFLRRKLLIERMKHYDALLIQALREESEKTSQKHVADKLGISPPYLNDFLMGRRTLTESVWERAASTNLRDAVETQET